MPKTSPFTDIAKAVGTPFYCYSTATLERHYRVFSKAFADVDAMVCYAMKANSNQAVLKTLGRLGAGIDVVSGGELRRALAAGIPASRIMFSGVGKTAREMDLALEAGIYCFNVESEPELEILNAARRQRSASRRMSPSASIRMSMPAPMPKISTGKKENKFGISWERARAVYAHAATLPGIEVTGIDMHIGSQITELQPFDDAFKLLRELVDTLRADGHTIDHVDVGGGLGIPYKDDNNPPPLPDAYANNRQEPAARPRLQDRHRAGPADRRQCRHPGDRGHLCEGWRRKDLRHRRRRHERPDPPDAL